MSWKARPRKVKLSGRRFRRWRFAVRPLPAGMSPGDVFMSVPGARPADITLEAFFLPNDGAKR